jgi:hypothetical protein
MRIAHDDGAAPTIDGAPTDAVEAVAGAEHDDGATRKRDRHSRRSRDSVSLDDDNAGDAAAAAPSDVAHDDSRRRDRHSRHSRHSRSRESDAAPDAAPEAAADVVADAEIAQSDAAAAAGGESAATSSKRVRPSDEKRFACPHCSYRFDRRGKLQTHIDAQHASAVPANGDDEAPPAGADTMTQAASAQVDAATDAMETGAVDGAAVEAADVATAAEPGAPDSAKRSRRAARK